MERGGILIAAQPIALVVNGFRGRLEVVGGLADVRFIAWSCC
jgi:hypothetical protein